MYVYSFTQIFHFEPQKNIKEIDKLFRNESLTSACGPTTNFEFRIKLEVAIAGVLDGFLFVIANVEFFAISWMFQNVDDISWFVYGTIRMVWDVGSDSQIGDARNNQ